MSPGGVTKPSELHIIPDICRSMWWLDSLFGICTASGSKRKTSPNLFARKDEDLKEDKVRMQISKLG